MKVLVIGAGGVFGSHLAVGLARAGFDLVLAGRDLKRAERAAAAVLAEHPGIAVEAIAVDTQTVTAESLKASGADIVADAAGPFQGSEPTVARAAIQAGLHYVDLADGRDFVARFGDLDEAARSVGVVALTGCSSTPALSHAVIQSLTEGWQSVVAVEAAISPGSKAPRGLSVMKAILSWLGRPVRVFDGARWCVRHGWDGLYHRDFGAAGRRLVSLCETPDLDLLAARFRPRERALFLAGLEPTPLHLGAWVLARAVALSGWSASGLAPLLLRMARPSSIFGSDRGAMRVEVLGADRRHRFARAVWLLTAAPGVGPVTPSLPALAAIKAIARGALAPGARACVGEVSLQDITREMVPHRLACGARVDRCLFSRALGDQFDTLPEAVRALHEAPGNTRWVGEADTRGSGSAPGRVLARIFGFPDAQIGVPVEVMISADGDRSVWRRRIGSSRFQSVLSNPSAGGLIEERFGPFTVRIRLRPDENRLWYEVAGWRLGPVPLPTILAPKSLTHERVDAEGRFVFDVEIRLPGLGRMAYYTGWLVAAAPEPDRVVGR